MKSKSSQNGTAWVPAHPFYPFIAAFAALLSYVITFYPLGIKDIMGAIFSTLGVWLLLYFILPRRIIILQPNAKKTYESCVFAREYLFRLQRIKRVKVFGIAKEKMRVEKALEGILAFIRAHPERENAAKGTLRLCFPTFEKLIFAWREVESQSVEGANMLKTKNEIKQGICEIANTLEKLSDSLFKERAMDISAEIQATKTVLNLDINKGR